MSLLFKIIYATHANGTHHKLALDALCTLTVEDAEAWRRLFLKHAELYMSGSKAPDKEFKDFRNHVLHVHDDYWGGAPEKVENWYDLLVRALREHNWSEAVWCAGILSHYYTDPIHPFHTAQSKAETDIHRAVEWSISKSYGPLRAEGLKRFVTLPEFGTGERWLKDAVIAGAEFSNRHYDTLVVNYDFARGVVEPPEGLTEKCRMCVAELLVYAAHGFGAILDRAIIDAGVKPPQVSLSAETVLATLRIPLKWITRKIDDANDRRLVEQMYDELTATGSVDKTLAEDDRVIRALYAKEVVPRRAEKRAQDRDRRRRNAPLPQGALARVSVAPTPNLPKPVGRPHEADGAAAERPEPNSTMATAAASLSASTPPPAPPTTPSRASVPIIGMSAKPPERSLCWPPPEMRPDPVENAQKFYLEPGDDIEAAPSIGPRTAERFYAIDIRTVEAFIAADPQTLAAALDTSWIRPQTIHDWQDQARLVMEIPELRGTHAQLLVGAGLRSATAVADADPASTQAAILRFVTTDEGKRILRNGNPPDLEKVTAWLTNARATMAA